MSNTMESYRVIAVEQKFGRVVNRNMLGDVYPNEQVAKDTLREWYGVKRFNKKAESLFVGKTRAFLFNKITFIIAQQSFYEEVAGYNK